MLLIYFLPSFKSKKPILFVWQFLQKFNKLSEGILSFKRTQSHIADVCTMIRNGTAQCPVAPTGLSGKCQKTQDPSTKGCPSLYTHTHICVYMCVYVCIYMELFVASGS